MSDAVKGTRKWAFSQLAAMTINCHNLSVDICINTKMF